MSVNPNEDTEFNDVLRKHGIIPPRELTPPSPSPPPSPTFDDLLNDFTPSELLEISEDAPDDEAERVIAAYQRERLAKELKERKKARFGQVYPIGRDDYTREVTEASNIDEEDDIKQTGTAVVCFLYKDGIPRSDRAFEHVRDLASRYPRTKFVSIVGDKCIPNLPDSRVPMFIVYKKGEIQHQIMAWGADEERHIHQLEERLMLIGAIHTPRDYREEADKRATGVRSMSGIPKGKSTKNTMKGDGSDSDFEFDL